VNRGDSGRPPEFTVLDRWNWARNVEVAEGENVGIARAVAHEIAFRANAHGSCWPSIDTITEDVGFSRNAVRKALNALVAAGRLYRRRPKGGYHACTYTIRINRAPTEHEVGPSRISNVLHASINRASTERKTCSGRASNKDLNNTKNKGRDRSHEPDERAGLDRRVANEGTPETPERNAHARAQIAELKAKALAGGATVRPPRANPLGLHTE
jgi:hypothetical protein